MQQAMVIACTTSQGTIPSGAYIYEPYELNLEVPYPNPKAVGESLLYLASVWQAIAETV